MKWIKAVKHYASLPISLILVSGGFMVKVGSLLLSLFGLTYRTWLMDVFLLDFLIGLFCLSIAVMRDSQASRMVRFAKYLAFVGGIGSCLVLSIVIWFMFLFTISGRADYENGFEKVYREVKEGYQYLYTETAYYRTYGLFFRENKPTKVDKFYP